MVDFNPEKKSTVILNKNQTKTGLKKAEKPSVDIHTQAKNKNGTYAYYNDSSNYGYIERGGANAETYKFNFIKGYQDHDQNPDTPKEPFMKMVGYGHKWGTDSAYSSGADGPNEFVIKKNEDGSRTLIDGGYVVEEFSKKEWEAMTSEVQKKEGVELWIPNNHNEIIKDMFYKDK